MRQQSHALLPQAYPGNAPPVMALWDGNALANMYGLYFFYFFLSAIPPVWRSKTFRGLKCECRTMETLWAVLLGSKDEQ